MHILRGLQANLTMNRLKMHSPDLTQANIDKLAAIADLFPNCVTESLDAKGALSRSVDFDQLRQELSTSIVEGPQERYQLNWRGKREALLTANAPIAKTLRPCRKESVDFDTKVVHAQFELLHPFKDGNGRIGRILIPLFLYQKRALSQPMFYLSEYLETNREAYYFHLKAISAEGDWNGWIAFFLKAIVTQAAQNSTRVTAIQALYEEMKLAIQTATHSQYSVHVLDAIFSKPIFR